MNKRGFIFEGIRWRPVINFVTLIYKYSYLISLEIVLGYRKVRISSNPGQFKYVPEKPDITYPSCEDLGPCWKYSISVRPTNFSKYHRGYNLFMSGVENLFINDRGSHRGASHRGTWTVCNHNNFVRAVVFFNEKVIFFGNKTWTSNYLRKTFLHFISYNIATYLFFQLYRKICKQSIWHLFSINQIITKWLAN